MNQISKIFIACFAGALGIILAIGLAAVLVHKTWLGDLVTPQETGHGKSILLDMKELNASLPLPKDYAEYGYSYSSSVMPAADLKIGEDVTMDFAVSKKDRDGITFYPQVVDGKDMDVYVQLNPFTKEMQLFSYPADRVGGSKGPAEPPDASVAPAETAEKPKSE